MTRIVRQRVAPGDAEESPAPMSGPNKIAIYWTALGEGEREDRRKEADIKVAALVIRWEVPSEVGGVSRRNLTIATLRHLQ